MKKSALNELINFDEFAPGKNNPRRLYGLPETVSFCKLQCVKSTAKLIHRV